MGAGCSHELVDRVGVDRLGAVERDPQRREVEARRVAQGPGRQHVGEVRAGGGGAAVGREPLHPADRRRQEVLRRAQHQPAAVGGAQHVDAHQAHVVVQRQPRHEDVDVGVVAGHRAVGVEVGADGVVREHDALRGGGAAGGELQRRRARPGRRPGRSKSFAVGRPGPRASSTSDTIGGSPGCGSMKGARSGSITSNEMSAARSRVRVWLANSSMEPSRIGSGSTTSVAPVSQTASRTVTSGRVVGPRTATWAPGATPRDWRAAAIAWASSRKAPQATTSSVPPVTNVRFPAPGRPAASSMRSARVRGRVGITPSDLPRCGSVTNR